MPAATFEQIAAWKPSLIRRANKGFVLYAPMSVSIPAAFTSGVSAEFQALPNFTSLGMFGKDGAPTWRPEVTSNDVEAWGALEPPRTDIISRKMTVSATALETKRVTLEQYSGVDLSTVEPDATTKEIQWADPTAPETRYGRLIFGMVDGSGADQIIILRVLPRAAVTEMGEQSWAQEQALSYNLTWSAKIDEDLGYSLKNVICGPGVASILADMDFNAAFVPVIESISPVGTLAAAGGETIVLRGTNFTGAVSVVVGGTAATDFQVVDDKNLAITTPAKTAGSHNVIVTNATGPSTGFAVTYA